jgi:hypothetical protein
LGGADALLGFGLVLADALVCLGLDAGDLRCGVLAHLLAVYYRGGELGSGCFERGGRSFGGLVGFVSGVFGLGELLLGLAAAVFFLAALPFGVGQLGTRRCLELLDLGRDGLSVAVRVHRARHLSERALQILHQPRQLVFDQLLEGDPRSRHWSGGRL